MSNAFQSFTGNLLTDVIQKTIGLLYEGGKAVLDYSSRLEQARIGFETFSGSAVLAQKHLDDLQKFARSTPFKFTDLVDASQKMQGVGINAERVIPVLEDVGNALSAAGRLGDLPLAIKALGDIQSKGKLAGQEIAQLANTGIPIRDILAKELGKSSEQIIEMGEKSEISAEMVFAALHKMSSEKFGDAMEKQSKTFSGALGNISDALNTTAATAFDPLYREISQITVKMAAEIGKAQSLNAAFDVLFEGAGNFIVLGAEKLGALFVQKLADTVTGKWSGIGFLGIPLLKGMINQQIDMYRGLGEYLGILDKKHPAAPLKDASTAVKEINKNVGETKSLADMLQAQKAKNETENLGKIILDLSGQIDFFGQNTQVAATKQKLLKQGITDWGSIGARTALLMAERLDLLNEATARNKKQFDTLKNTISNLSLQVSFFGDETQEAATKQQLLSQGITDFNSGLARTAIEWAKTLDRLTANKKQQDEYNDKLKSALEHIRDLRADAQFEMRFANPTELDRFTTWVDRNARGMFTLKKEINATAMALWNLQVLQGARKRDEHLTDLLGNLDKQIAGFKRVDTSPIKNVYREIAESLNLKGLTTDGFGIDGFDETADAFAGSVKAFVDQINIASKNFPESVSAVEKRFKSFLASFYDSSSGKSLQVFADDTLDALIKKFVELDRVVSATARSEGLVKLDEILGSLKLQIGGIRGTTEIEDLMRTLSDPNMAASISLMAKELGYTTEQLKEIFRLAAENKANPLSSATRPRIVPLEEDKQDWRDFAEDISSIMGDAFNNLREKGFKGMLSGMLLDFAETINKMAVQWFTSELFKGITNEKESQSSGKNWLARFINIGISAVAGAFTGGAAKGAAPLATRPRIVPGLASGGYAQANKPHIVGENGWELFIPKQGGLVVNQQQLAAMSGQMGSSQTIINNNFYANPKTGAFSKPSAEQEAKRFADMQTRAMRRR